MSTSDIPNNEQQAELYHPSQNLVSRMNVLTIVDENLLAESGVKTGWKTEPWRVFGDKAECRTHWYNLEVCQHCKVSTRVREALSCRKLSSIEQLPCELLMSIMDQVRRTVELPVACEIWSWRRHVQRFVQLREVSQLFRSTFDQSQNTMIRRLQDHQMGHLGWHTIVCRKIPQTYGSVCGSLGRFRANPKYKEYLMHWREHFRHVEDLLSGNYSAEIREFSSSYTSDMTKARYRLEQYTQTLGLAFDPQSCTFAVLPLLSASPENV